MIDFCYNQFFDKRGKKGNPVRAKFIAIIISSVMALNVVAAPKMHHKNNHKNHHNQPPAKTFDSKQTQEIEQIIHNYLINNPEVLVKASRALQRKQQAQMMSRAKRAIALNRTSIFEAKSPVAGNPKGQVSLVEFFDYQCKHCKNMSEVVHGLIKDNAHLKVIYKQLPIFGAESEFASRAALAARNQNKYKELHTALMAYDERLSEEIVLKVAKDVGIDVDKLKADMNDPAIGAELKENLTLAQKIGIMGTPAFIVASQTNSDNIKSYFVAGALSKPMLQNLINEMKK